MADRQSPADVPPKLFFRIGEVAGLVGVEPHVLRYWEREFRSIRPTKSAKGQRVYSRKDVENLLRVRDLLYRDGFTIAGAKKKLQRGGVEQHEHVELARPLALGAFAPPAIPREFVAEEFAPREIEAVPSAPSAPPVSVEQARSPRSADPQAPDSDAEEPSVREKLYALRSEVEGFLAELTKAH